MWLLLAGRGFGKTRTGAEWVRDEVERNRRGRLALIAPTAADVRDVMVEGESGLLATARPSFRPQYEPSKRRLTWPSGAMATTFSADEPDRLRGPQFDGFWADEIAVWRYPETWDNLMMGNRLGDPRGVVTTTPKPVRLVRDLLKPERTDVIVTRGTTYENVANLAPAFTQQILARYEGTRLGRQELYAEVLTEVPGALWTRDQIDATRLVQAPELERIMVAIDPAATAQEDSDETGIVAAGRGVDEHYYVLVDGSFRGSPDAWGRKAVALYEQLKGDRIVAEANQGGDMVEHVIRTVDPRVPYKAVHASRGKQLRAEPIAALYEQGKVHHVGAFRDLEDQMCTWLPGDASPDRLDALVWAITELMEGGMRLLGSAELPKGDPLRGDRPSWIW